MSWLRRLCHALWPSTGDADVERELTFHLTELTDHLQADGLSEQEARRRARIRFGSLPALQERTREFMTLLWLDAARRHASGAWRSLARSPAFALTVVVTLAVSVGANAVVFAVIDAVLLRPLPFPDGDRLMRVRQIQEGSGETNIAPPRLHDWQTLNTTFDAITGYFTEDTSDTSGDFPERVRRAFVTPGFLDVWGVEPAIGRGFTAGEHLTGGPAAVLVSHRYWRERRAAAANILDHTVRIGADTFPIVGVMPASFLFPDRNVELWLPAATDAPVAQSRHATWYTGVGRLKTGVTTEQGRANLEAIQANLAAQYPATDARIRVEMVPLKEATIGGIQRALWVVYGAVFTLLLITCVNVAGLLLTRVSHRQPEFAVRRALGASTRAVGTHVVAEVLMLTVAGAGLGWLIVAMASRWIRVAVVTLPRVDEVVVNGRTAVFTCGCVALVALACGVLPALHAIRARAASALGSGRAPATPRHALQWWLVGAQVALSVTLLASAGLLGRSVLALSRVETGFEVDHILAFRVSGSFAETANRPQLAARIDDTLETLRALPGVQAAATAIFLPGLPARFESALTVEGARTESDRPIVAELRVVTAEYFETLQIPLLLGEPCGRPTSGARGELLVNRQFVRRYLSDRPSPLAVHVAAAHLYVPPSVIRGVVGDAHEAGLHREPVPTVYLCDSAAHPMPYFLVRTQGDPRALGPSVRTRLREVDPLRAVYDLAPLEQRLGDAFAQGRVRAILVATFSAIALVLACLGVFATLSYGVGLQRKEIGVQLALGAGRGAIVRRLVSHALRVVTAGAVIGLALSLSASSLLTGMVFGISTADPLALASAVVIMVGVATVAALIPAVRAARLEPSQTLREG